MDLAAPVPPGAARWYSSSTRRAMGWRVPPWQVKTTEGGIRRNRQEEEEEGGGGVGSYFEVVAHGGDVDDESVLGGWAQPQDGSRTNEKRADVQRSFAVGRHLAQRGDDTCQRDVGSESMYLTMHMKHGK